MELPQNLDAERALLGAMLFDNRQIDEVQCALPGVAVSRAIASLSPQDKFRKRSETNEPLFYSSQNELIFGSICSIHSRGVPIDMTTLGEELLRFGHLDESGGVAYLASLTDDLFSPNMARNYAKIVEEKWRLRCLIRASQATIEDAANSSDSADKVIEQAERRMFEVAHERNRVNFVHISDAVSDQLSAIQRFLRGGELSGLMTGFPRLDAITAGFRPGNLIILAARPGIGKTALAMNFADHAAQRVKRPVAFFSLEMSVDELTLRLLCSAAHVSQKRVRAGTLSIEEQVRLQEAAERLQAAPLHIDDTSGLSVLELRARARRLKAQYPDLGLIVIDYLQLMSGGGRFENRQQEVSEISRSLKGLAKELSVPVLALSQLSRQPEQRAKGDNMPRLSDLRESGAIEQDSDIVLFIHRDKMTKEEAKRPGPKEALLLVGKNRHGEADKKIGMIFHGEYSEFIETDFERRD